MSKATISRQDYDKLKIEETLAEHRNFEVPWTEAVAQQFFNDGYPKTTEQVIEELIERGLAATPWRISNYCEDPTLAPPILAGVRVWSKDAIDKLAAAMEADGKLTGAARWRKDHRIGWQDEKIMLARERAIRKDPLDGNVE